jgi:CrcB protein
VTALLLVMAGAAVGAGARFLTDRAIQARHDSLFPWGTFTVNVIGSFVLGAITARVPSQVQLLVGAGVCGGLTTYSTFSYETLRLAEEGSSWYALLNVVGSVAFGVAAAVSGMVVADWVLRS